MAISPKPQRKKLKRSPETPDIQEKEIQSLIEKGGSVAKSDEKKSKKQVVPITLRIPNHIIERIAQVIASRPIRIPRHTWILEAILEKLEREENSN